MNQFKELLRYVVKRKKWWIFPVILFLVLLGLLLFLPTTSVLSPFVYTLF